MAAAPPPAQVGAGASGDEDENGNIMLLSKYLYLHMYGIWTPDIKDVFLNLLYTVELRNLEH